MDAADWAQTLSFPLVALALYVSSVQTRAAVRQTKHLADQNKSLASSLTQGAHVALTRNQIDHRTMFFHDDENLLDWYLSSRGYPSSTFDANKRRLYVLTRMDMHQLNFVNYEAGFLAHDFWQSWKTVVETDLKIPEFAELWPILRNFYAPGFVKFCDRTLSANSAARPAVESPH
jgi:hypothetical protein